MNRLSMRVNTPYFAQEKTVIPPQLELRDLDRLVQCFPPGKKGFRSRIIPKTDPRIKIELFKRASGDYELHKITPEKGHRQKVTVYLISAKGQLTKMVGPFTMNANDTISQAAKNAVLKGQPPHTPKFLTQVLKEFQHSWVERGLEPNDIKALTVEETPPPPVTQPVPPGILKARAKIISSKVAATV